LSKETAGREERQGEERQVNSGMHKQLLRTEVAVPGPVNTVAGEAALFRSDLRRLLGDGRLGG
jgi:hypothetical protein